MTAFQPGDMVECVDANPATPDPTRRTPKWFAFYENCARRLTLGAIYTVRSVGDGLAPDSNDCVGVFLLELPDGPDPEGKVIGWSESRFRLVYRPKADLIKRLTAAPAERDLAEVGAGGRKQAEPASAGEHKDPQP